MRTSHDYIADITRNVGIRIGPTRMNQLTSSTFQLHWQDEEHSILMAGFPRVWTMDEVYPFLDRMTAMMDMGASEQAIIFDLTGTRIPQDAPRHFRQLLTSSVIEHRALRLVVVIAGNSRPVEVMVNVFNRLHQLFHPFPLISVPTLPEAMDTIARFRADN